MGDGGGRFPVNDEVLETQYFPKLMRQLRETGEVLVEYLYYSQFSHFLMHQDFDLWMMTEQEAGVTDDGKARFFTRRPPGRSRES